MSVNQFFRKAQEAEFKRLYPKSLTEQIAEKDAEIAERLLRTADKNTEGGRYYGEIKRETNRSSNVYLTV